MEKLLIKDEPQNAATGVRADLRRLEPEVRKRLCEAAKILARGAVRVAAREAAAARAKGAQTNGKV